MRRIFPFALGMLELLTSWRPQGGLISAQFAGWRALWPHGGALAELTSSSFLALALSLPILIHSEAAARSFRMHVIIPKLAFLVSRRHQNTLKVVTVCMFLLCALACVRTVSLFLTDGLQFVASSFPTILLLTALLLRFVLLNLPGENELLIPLGGALEEIGDVREPAIYSLAAGMISFHCDFHLGRHHNQEGILQYWGPDQVVKKAGEKALVLQPDTTWMAEIKEKLRLPQTELRLRIDVATPRNLASIRCDPVRLRNGVPTPEALLPEVKRLVDAELKIAIRENSAFQTLEQYTNSYLLSNTEFLTYDLQAMQQRISGMERIRQVMDTAAVELAIELQEALTAETFKLYGGLLYCRVYIEEIHLNEMAETAFHRMRSDLQRTLIGMREDRLGDMNAVANLLKSVENMDVPYVILEELLNRVPARQASDDESGSPRIRGRASSDAREARRYQEDISLDASLLPGSPDDEMLFGRRI